MIDKDLPAIRLRRLIQRLKALILQDLDPITRDRTKTELSQLDESYTNKLISIDEYKQKSLKLLFQLADWDVSRVEQFLYRYAGKALTQSDIWQICEFLQKVRE